MFRATMRPSSGETTGMHTSHPHRITRLSGTHTRQPYTQNNKY